MFGVHTLHWLYSGLFCVWINTGWCKDLRAVLSFIMQSALFSMSTVSLLDERQRSLAVSAGTRCCGHSTWPKALSDKWAKMHFNLLKILFTVKIWRHVSSSLAEHRLKNSAQQSASIYSMNKRSWSSTLEHWMNSWCRRRNTWAWPECNQAAPKDQQHS